MIQVLANSLWLAGCIPEHLSFLRAVSRVREEQENVLRRILRANAGTEFGIAHEFASIRSSAEYRRRVPLADYQQLEPWITRAAAGVPNVLTREAINLFEPTSGSSSENCATKLIPYTASLQREFQHGIQAWIGDLFLHMPSLMAGQAYWSVSPVNRDVRRTPGGIKIGFEDDTSYLGGWQKQLANAVMAVPANVRLESDLDRFRYTTLLHLVRSRKLTLVSIWNPTFFELLVDRLPEWVDRIAYDIAHGTMCPAEALRAREVREALKAGSRQEVHERLWPNLKLISCWSDANAEAPAARLAALFPHSKMQGKGLLATEAFVSLPLLDREGAALAVRSHFFEFLPDGDDRPQLAHQLEQGVRYNVVVTTGGGLYRYRLGDQIEVAGCTEQCPLIRFMGRQGYVSDWFGEKLDEAHVSRVLQQVFLRLGVKPAFAMLACDTESQPAYVLYLDLAEPNHFVARVAEEVDAGLRENFHYDYARRLGQLDCVRAHRVSGASELYCAEAMRRGQRLGDIKVLALDRSNGWSRVFGVTSATFYSGKSPKNRTGILKP